MMLSKKIFIVAPLLTIWLLTTSCSSKPALVEQAPAPSQSAPASTPAKAPVAVAPKLPEVEEAVRRVFKDAAVVHPDYKDRFLTGDFNGDLSQDLAVILKPVPDKLTELNEEPRWLLRDPLGDPNRRVPLRIEKDDVLLAVIHGYGANDWRDPEATQTFLLKNVVGSEMRVQNGKEFVTANSGHKIPRPHGDLIGETLKGAQGYLYYAAATYSWYDPKTFKGESEAPGAFHGRNAMRR